MMSPRVFCALLTLLAASAAAADPKPHVHVHHAEEPADAPSTDSLFHLKSRWTDQDGKRTTLSLVLKDRVAVVAMVYTSCQAACPLIVSDMQAIQRGVAGPGVRYLLVSMDPARDTPARLKEYAQQRRLDGAQWTLLTGTGDDVQELAAVLGVRFKQLPNGDFAHSNLISVLDGHGVVRHQQMGLKQDPAATLKVLQTLVAPAGR